MNMLKTTVKTLALSLVLAQISTATAADLLLSGADLYPVSSAPIMGGDLLIRDGKIAALGPAGSLDAASAMRVDVSGKRIYPGFVLANTVLGLTEIEAVRASNDYVEVGPLNPNVRAESAVNPDSELIPVARSAGIVAAHIAPQNQGGAVFTGRSAVLRLTGWTWESMTIKADSGQHLVWPSARAPDFLPANIKAEIAKAAQTNLQLIDDSLADARRYAAADGTSSARGIDLRHAALKPVLDGSQRLYVHADDYSTIRASIDFCSKEKLRCVLVGGSDAWRLAADLKAASIPVILGTPFAQPLRRHDGFDAVYRNAARLHAAGVQIAIASDGSSFGASLEKNLPHLAAQAIAYGLPYDAGLRAITLGAAELSGVADRLGSLQPGKDASLIVSSGDPLEFDSQIEAVYIDGIAQDLGTRHTRLYQKYLQRIDTAKP
jgi:imidazolonepropionase-like amidohydrolase